MNYLNTSRLQDEIRKHQGLWHNLPKSLLGLLKCVWAEVPLPFITIEVPGSTGLPSGTLVGGF